MDSHHFNAYPALAFHCIADPDPAPDLHQGDANLRPLAYRLFLQASILTFQASILSVHGPPRLQFEPGKLLIFDFNADPYQDPAFHSYADPDPASTNIADPDPYPASKNNGSGSGSETLVQG